MIEGLLLGFVTGIAVAGVVALFLWRSANPLREAFKAISADALRENNQAFLELAETKLSVFQRSALQDLQARQAAVGAVVQPIETALKQVDGKLAEIEKQRVGAYAEIRSQMTGMAATQKELESQTAKLVNALRTPHVRGRWGEIQLRRVVEIAGMEEHCDFVEQQTRETADGRLRPDLIVKLPGGKQIIVDAKTPLAAYLESLEAPDDQIRVARLVAHARQVRDHMARLSAKSYWDQFPATPDLVVMFLPGEMFFSAALQHDPTLIEKGMESRVIPASPTTLIALLRAVSYGWQQERIAANAQAIRDLGKDLYDRLGTLAGHVRDIGGGLRRALEAYNRAVGSIEYSVLPGARRFKDLGALASEEIQPLEPVAIEPRAIQAAELLPPPKQRHVRLAIEREESKPRYW